jgi:hypothetical protein
MRRIFLPIILAIVLSGCNSTGCKLECKPVIFPYMEHAYKADPYQLSGKFVPNNDNEMIEYHDLKIEVPKGWGHEIPFGDTLLLFSPGKEQTVMITYEPPTAFGTAYDPNGIHLLGCDNFEVNEPGESKTAKDFFKDLFLFTEIDFEASDFQPTFWHYFILWAKVDHLKNVENMVHYQGNNLEAFRSDKDYKKLKNLDLYSKITLFHKKYEPNYYTIATSYNDDDFVNNFIDMIDVLN